MSSPRALHSKNTPKWGTPKWLIAFARTLLGEIHMDPATSPEFNTLVQALLIYTDKDNGLAQEWGGNIFLNPPGGLVTEFWEKLCDEIRAGRVSKAFWVGFSVEQLATLGHDTKTLAEYRRVKQESGLESGLDLTELDNEPWHPLDFSICILRKRISFNTEGLEKGGSPSHSNYVVAIGCDKAEFERLFSPYGKVSHGKLA